MGDWVIQTIAIFLKVDIEGSELTALPQWIESGALDKVTFICCSSFSNVFGPRWSNLLWSFTFHQYTNRKGLPSHRSLPKKSTIELSSFWQVSVAAESSTAAVHLGVPSHQPRSEHDGEQIHLHFKCLCTTHCASCFR